jgi:uncharacterized protein (TIGR02266 family)
MSISPISSRRSENGEMDKKTPGFMGRIRARFFKTVSDRRKYTRVPISVKVTNMDSGNFAYALGLNISISGMFLRADEPLAKGTPLTLQFTLPGQDEIVVKADVVRVQAPSPSPAVISGMGVRFIDLTEAAHAAVVDFVAHRA